MNLLAQQLIEREEVLRTGYLDLGCCGLTELPDLSELEWLNLETPEQQIAEVPQKQAARCEWIANVRPFSDASSGFFSPFFIASPSAKTNTNSCL